MPPSPHLLLPPACSARRARDRYSKDNLLSLTLLQYTLVLRRRRRWLQYFSTAAGGGGRRRTSSELQDKIMPVVIFQLVYLHIQPVHVAAWLSDRPLRGQTRDSYY